MFDSILKLIGLLSSKKLSKHNFNRKVFYSHAVILELERLLKEGKINIYDFHELRNLFSADIISIIHPVGGEDIFIDNSIGIYQWTGCILFFVIMTSILSHDIYINFLSGNMSSTYNFTIICILILFTFIIMVFVKIFPEIVLIDRLYSTMKSLPKDSPFLQIFEFREGKGNRNKIFINISLENQSSITEKQLKKLDSSKESSS